MLKLWPRMDIFINTMFKIYDLDTVLYYINNRNKNSIIKYNFPELENYYKNKNLYNNKNEECPICCLEIEYNQYIRRLNCNHKYHKKCIDKWLIFCLKNLKCSNCPMCRTVVK